MIASDSADRVLTIYKASAGSGKTYTLTYEYILALLSVKNPATGEYRLNHARYMPSGVQSNRHRGILAITFTNKATEEMKSRITARLHDLTRLPAPGEKDADYAAELCAVTSCTRQELAESANEALKQLLYDFHNFNVSTIDSFFQRVLRNFARELDRQGDFEIELSVSAVMSAAVDAMLDDFNVSWREKKSLERWLSDYMKSAIEEGSKSNILDRNSTAHRKLVCLISSITSETFAPYEKEMKEYLLNSDKISRLARAVKERIGELLKISADEARELMAQVEALPKTGGMSKRCQNLINDKIIGSADMKFKDVLTQLRRAEEADDYYNKGAIAPPPLQDETRALIYRCMLRRVRIEELRHISKGLHTLAFLSFAWGYLDRLLTENNVVMLASANSLISRIIDGSDVPFIYERLGVRLHHFLIDEFQDTSTMQWENLKPLVANSVSERHDNLIIGDVKQSIYRFRNSEPDLLHRRVQDDDFPLYAKLRGELDKDNTNYRSAVEIVKFNNTLFSLLPQMLNVPGYEHVVQAIPPKNADCHGFVHFIPVMQDENEDSDKGEQLTDEEKMLKKFPSLPLMASEMRRQIDEGGYRFRDIAVLCSKRDECAAVIEYLLKNHPDIPVLTDEALYLVKSPAVKLIISVLRLISNVRSARGDSGSTGHEYATLADMNLAVSRYEYFVSDSASDISPEEALSKALSDTETVDDAVRRILSSHPASLQALIDNIISARVPEKMRSEQLPYIMALQDYVAEYCERGLQTVNAFLRWWDEHSAKFSIPLGSDIDAVNVLTVHKSKGLEFKCLHIPFASWELLSKRYLSDARWIEMPRLDGIDAELLPPVVLLGTNTFDNCPESVFYDEFQRYKAEGVSDTVNLTYVAYTRAASELIAYYNPKKGIGQNLLSAFSLNFYPDEHDVPYTVDLASCFDEATGEFILGSPTKAMAEKEKTEVAESYSPSYQVCHRPDAQVITSVDSVLELDPDIDDCPPPPRRKGEEPPQVRRGNMMHEILSNTRRYDDLSQAVALVAAASNYDASEVKEAGTFLAEALNLSRDNLARWFRDYERVLCEQSIYINTGTSLPATRRPDRIVFLPDGTVEVVDFKFTSEEQPEHIDQVHEYVTVLRAMGYKVTGGWLWYPLLPGSPVVTCMNG